MFVLFCFISKGFNCFTLHCEVIVVTEHEILVVINLEYKRCEKSDYE